MWILCHFVKASTIYKNKLHELISLIRISCAQYRQLYNISGALIGIDVVDHSDVVGAAPVAAPTTPSFST